MRSFDDRLLVEPARSDSAMALIARLGDLDGRAWATATWTVPFVSQIFVAVVVGATWPLGKVFVGAHGALLFLASAAIALVVAAAAAGALIRSGSSRAKGLAISVAGSYIVVVVGGFIYGIWIIQW